MANERANAEGTALAGKGHGESRRHEAAPEEAPVKRRQSRDEAQDTQRWLAEAARAEAEAAAAELPAATTPPGQQEPPSRDAPRCGRDAAARALCCPAYVACAALESPGCANCDQRLALLRSLTCGLPCCLFAVYAAVLSAACCCLQCDGVEWAKERRTAAVGVLTCRAWGAAVDGEDPDCVKWAVEGQSGPCFTDG